MEHKVKETMRRICKRFISCMDRKYKSEEEMKKKDYDAYLVYTKIKNCNDIRETKRIL